ncbi:MAG: hypothetical protein ACRDV3_04155, partial [Acidothermaceae bacterium]
MSANGRRPGTVTAEGGDFAERSGGAPPNCRPRLARLWVVAGVARIEAVLLIRSVLLLVGVIGGLALFWQFAGYHEPLWWVVSWQIGHGQVVVSTTALIAGQLAAGRVRRDELIPLYESFPTSASTRAGAQLAGLIGVLPASLLLLAVAFATTELRTPIGSPDAATLAAGVLLVVAGGAIGVAIGTGVPHPLAGVVAALVWLLLYGQSNQFNGTAVWLFPWLRPDLDNLPHAVTGYPPSVAHALELAGIAVFAGAVTLALVARNARPRASAALVSVVVAAGLYGTAAVQLRPVPTSSLDALFTEAANPASTEECTTANQVRYCLYPGFASLLPAIRGPVDAVLSRLPSPPAEPLTVRQATVIFADNTSLTAGHSADQITGWNAQLQAAPQNTPRFSTIYVPIGRWPAGSKLAAARFDVALDTAVWAVGLPPSI